MWALHPLPSRSTFHFSLFTFHFPKGALFTFHSSLFTSRRDAFHLNDAVRCIGHRSALHWALQCAAQAIAVRCVFRCTFMHVRGHAAMLSFPEDRKQKCCAMGYTAQHCLPYTFALSAQPAQTYARQKGFPFRFIHDRAGFPKGILSDSQRTALGGFIHASAPPFGARRLAGTRLGQMECLLHGLDGLLGHAILRAHI